MTIGYPTLADAFILVLRVAAVLAFGLVASRLLRRSAAKRVVLSSAIAGALALPAVVALAPAWHVESAVAVQAREVAEALVEAPSPAFTAFAPAPAEAPRPERPVDVRVGPRVPLATVWFFGTAALLLRLALGHARVRRLVRKSERADWSDPRVRYAAVDAPAVTGIFRPIILVPEAAHDWSVERRRAVVLHELAHVRQHDCLVQLLAELACAVHWFNPLVWVAARQLRVVRELAADAAVLASGLRASTYAEHLVAIAAGRHDAPIGALGMASDLETRVVAIVAPPPKRLGRAAATGLVALTASTCAVIACAQPAEREPRATTVAAPAATTPPSTLTGDTVDPTIQAIADEELARALHDSKARGGTIVVLDPTTGAVVADARSNLEPAYVTGSTLKSLVLAGALEDGIVRADERFDLEQGSFAYHDKRMHDAGRYGTLSVPEMLAVSSNIGFTKLFDRMGGERLGKWLHAFHIGDAPGTMPSRIEDKTFAGAMVAIGESATATPLQLASAYGAIANGGIYVPPTRTRGAPPKGERILSERTTSAVRTMLEGVVYGAQATGKRAQVDGIRVAGKTGTAEWDLPGGGIGTYASFAGFAPSSAAPKRFVIVVGIDRPTSEEKAGGLVAAPAFARVATRALR